MFDEILAYRFDTFVGGHLTDIGTRQDVEITKEFTLDVYNTVKRIHNNMDATAAMSEAVKTVGTGQRVPTVQGVFGQGRGRFGEGA